MGWQPATRSSSNHPIASATGRPWRQRRNECEGPYSRIQVSSRNPPESLVDCFVDGFAQGDAGHARTLVAIDAAMTGEPIVELRNLSKSYRRGGQIVPVLSDITLDIPVGE